MQIIIRKQLLTLPLHYHINPEQLAAEQSMGMGGHLVSHYQKWNVIAAISSRASPHVHLLAFCRG